MMKFEIGDVVWVRAKVWDRSRHPDRLMLEVGNGEIIAGESDCKPYAEPDIKQAIREVLLSGEFLTAFAAAWMKTPLPIGEYAEPGQPANAKAIPGAPAGWKLVGFRQIQDDVKVFDEDGDYWTFSGTNDAGDLTGALMPIFEKIEATNDPA